MFYVLYRNEFLYNTHNLILFKQIITSLSVFIMKWFFLYFIVVPLVFFPFNFVLCNSQCCVCLPIPFDTSPFLFPCPHSIPLILQHQPVLSSAIQILTPNECTHIAMSKGTRSSDLWIFRKAKIRYSVLFSCNELMEIQSFPITCTSCSLRTFYCRWTIMFDKIFYTLPPPKLLLVCLSDFLKRLFAHSPCTFKINCSGLL